MTTIVKVFGLTVGFVITLFLSYYIFHALSFNRFHENYDRIYRLVNHRNIDYKSTRTTAMFMDFIEINYPEVDEMSRFYKDEYLFQFQSNSFKLKEVLFVDSSFLKIFSFQLIEGNRLTALKEPYSIVLTENVSKKIFGNENPIGKTILCDNRYNLTVTGIMEDFPSNSSIQGEAMVSFVSLKDMWDEEFNILEDEGAWAFDLFLLMNSKSEKHDLEEKLSNGLRKRFGQESNFRLQELDDFYFEKDIEDRFIHGDLPLILILIASTIIILLFAIVNYINLTAVTTVSRYKEVVIHRIHGAIKQQRVLQSIFESIFICIISFILALVVVEMLEPFISNALNIRIRIYKVPYALILTFILTLLIGIISGLYPSFITSSYKSLNIIRGQTTSNQSGILFRKSLIIFQFCLSVVLICFTIHIYRQAKYLKSKALGFDIENIIGLKLNETIAPKLDVLKERLYQYPAIQKIALSDQLFGDVGDAIGFKKDGERYSLKILKADPDFLPLMNIKIRDGRNFSWDKTGDIANNVWILNNEAVKYLNWDNILEREIWDRPIVGIVEDFHYNSLHEIVSPLVISCYKCESKWMSIKSSAKGMDQTVEHINDIWNELCPEYPFEYLFLKDTFEKQYKSEDQFASLLLLFSIIGIYIAFLGLYSVSSFIIKKRTSEISIRKTFGAHAGEIVKMLSFEYVKLTIFANIIAFPLAFFGIKKWLQNYPYSIDVNYITFIVVGIVTIIITVIAVLTHIIKISNISIAETIKYE